MTATSLSLSLSRVVNHNACCSNDIDLGRREGSRDRAAAAAEGQNSGAKPQPRRWQWQARPILPFVAADRNHVASSMEKNRTRGSMSATRRRRLPHHQLLSGGAGGGGEGGTKKGRRRSRREQRRWGEGDKRRHVSRQACYGPSFPLCTGANDHHHHHLVGAHARARPAGGGRHQLAEYSPTPHHIMLLLHEVSLPWLIAGRLSELLHPFREGVVGRGRDSGAPSH